MSLRFEVRREQFNLLAHFSSPVFDLFKDFSGLVQHLFRALGSYGLRLADMKLDSAGESLGEVNLRLSWTDLATVRLFLDRIDLVSYPPFLRLQNGRLVTDLLSAVSSYSQDISFRAFGVTQEVHGLLDSPPKDFLSRFSAHAPRSLGPSWGSGTVFYFGAEENRLAGSIALDFSRVVESGLFLKLVVMYDALQVDATDLPAMARSQLVSVAEEIGLTLVGD